MIHVIKPLGEGKYEKFNWFKQASLYFLGSTISSTFLGLLISWIGKIHDHSFSSLLLFLCGAVSLIYSLNEFGLIKAPMPQIKWQVPVSWVAKRRFVGTFVYGLTIGTGFLTYITFPGYYLLIIITFSLGNINLGMLFFFLYGLGRSLPVFFSYQIHKHNFNFMNFLFSNVKTLHFLSGIVISIVGIVLIL